MNQKQRILILLAKKGCVSSVEFNREICFWYSARIVELRRAGFDIWSERDENGLWWYRLMTPTNQIDWEKMQPKPQTLKQEGLF